MRPMQWLGITVAAVGSVLMSYSDRFSSASIGGFVDQQAGQHIQGHWCFLMGIAIVLGGGLIAQLYQPSARSS